MRQAGGGRQDQSGTGMRSRMGTKVGDETGVGLGMKLEEEVGFGGLSECSSGSGDTGENGGAVRVRELMVVASSKAGMSLEGVVMVRLGDGGRAGEGGWGKGLEVGSGQGLQHHPYSVLLRTFR